MRVALATSSNVAPSDHDDGALLEALSQAGHHGDLVDWRDPAASWRDFDAVVVRSTWDYHEDRDAFVAWAAAVGAHTPLWNNAEVVRWNTHKGYLLELEERGAPVVPTAWLAAGDRVDLADLLAARRWREAVVKPAVGVGAVGVQRVGPDATGQAALDALLEEHDVLVQPFLHRIADTGELSVILIDGVVTHALRKVPRGGEFRIHSQHGGTYARAELDDEVVRLAEWIVEATGHDLLYARVDLMPDALGAWQLSELEATDPSLYLGHAPEAADRLVLALERRIVGAVATAEGSGT
jgi:glutathione synthase/RimK-type ligase-like ATP-grasp enzyme